ncbi:MAG: hypothetical protein IPK16_31620 [Anaerolineales bacterium]|nr:hypothetical protein [Anaerolineales bacterium]
MQQHFLRRGWKHLVAALWIAGLLWLKLDSQAAQAITPAQAEPERATTVSGKLSPSEYHYLGLEPSLRDGTVVLTLAVEPADDAALRGAIDFVVLTEDGLRRVLAGADPLELDIAASQPLQFDPIGNKFQAMFKASGRGNYTVVVYNDGGKFGSYLLTALNAVLVDDAGQVDVVTPAAPPLQTPVLTETSTPTETLQAEVSLAKASPLGLFGSTGGPAPAVDALRISGSLDKLLNRHFLAIKPGDSGGDVNLTMTYEPQGDQTREQVNFWLLDNDDVRQLLYGLRPEDVAFATGLPQPFNAAQNVKVAGFTAPDINEYTVIPYSTAPISVSYVMQIDGGLLADRYGQTNESRLHWPSTWRFPNP